ncbi:fumarylacetoacetate hydrolase family protein [Brevibacterium album]|uniref:fumarylacetoacetate hydrolase family protein n=1 Tax=Brevibacterium album TaxID=417948 RepID=UPI0003F96981|nr:fumarylacetoacetate hydrolase family protein [Brevibacterium album]
MRFASLRVADGRELGLVADGLFHPIRGCADVTEAIERGEDLLALGEAALQEPGRPFEERNLASPLRPPAMRDCMCFHEHIRNCSPGQELDPLHSRFPAYYITNSNAVIGPHDDVRIPPGSTSFDFELELCAVLGRAVSNLTPEEAREAVLGYTTFLDWSARDLQFEEMQLRLGPAKGKDSATTLGPYFVTTDEFAGRESGLSYDIAMRAWVNGEQIADGNWNTINWNVGDVIAYAARGTTLSAGEVLGSGTVGGGCLVEHERTGSEKFSRYLQPGDVVETSIDLLGSTRQTIAPALPRHPLSSGH